MHPMTHIYVCTHWSAPCSDQLRSIEEPGHSMAKRRAKKAAAAAEGVVEKEGGKAPPVKDAPANGVVVSVPVHCDGCARKLRRSLLRLEGVDEVIVDHSTDTVVVTGQRALENPIMVVDAVKRRTGKKALLLSPSPEKLPPPVKSEDTKKQGAGAPDMKNDVAELDMEMVVVLKIELHCEDCSEEMKRRILKIKGVEEAVPHIKSSQLMVKGMVEPATLVGFIHKCTGRKAAIIRAEPLHEDTPAAAMDEATPADAGAKNQESSNILENKNEGVEEETKQAVNGAGGEEAETEKPTKGGGDGVEKETVIEENQTKDHLFKLHVPASVAVVAPEAEKMMAMNGLCQYNYHPAAYAYAYPHYAYQQYHQYPYAGNPATYVPYPQHYPPQTFSEQSPEACTIM
uniref:HMA domain-containing protein n=2 Tax=Hordeum vulgare subsp. vulgare TaxID=112509 RepID=A0A8I6XGK1_HORVV